MFVFLLLSSFIVHQSTCVTDYMGDITNASAAACASFKTYGYETTAPPTAFWRPLSVHVHCDDVGAINTVHQFCIFDDIGELPVYCDDVSFLCTDTWQTFPLTPTPWIPTNPTGMLHLYISGLGFQNQDTEMAMRIGEQWAMGAYDLRNNGLSGISWGADTCSLPMYYTVEVTDSVEGYSCSVSDNGGVCGWMNWFECDIPGTGLFDSPLDCSSLTGGTSCSNEIGGGTCVLLNPLGEVYGSTATPCSTSRTYGYEVSLPTIAGLSTSPHMYWKPTEVSVICEVGVSDVFQFCIFEEVSFNLPSRALYCDTVTFACDTTTQRFVMTDPNMYFLTSTTSKLYIFVSGNQFHPRDSTGPDRVQGSFFQSDTMIDLMGDMVQLSTANWNPSHDCDVPLYYDIEILSENPYYVGSECDVWGGFNRSLSADGFCVSRETLIRCDGDGKISAIVNCTLERGSGSWCHVDECIAYLGEAGHLDTMLPCSSYGTYGYEVVEPDAPYWRPQKVHLGCDIGLSTENFQFCIFDDMNALPMFCQDFALICDATLHSFDLVPPAMSFASTGTNPLYLFVSSVQLRPSDILGFPDRTNFWQSIPPIDIRSGLEGATWQPSHGCDIPLYFEVELLSAPTVYDVGGSCTHPRCDGSLLVDCVGSIITSIVDCPDGCISGECFDPTAGTLGEVGTPNSVGCSVYRTYGYEVLEPIGPNWVPDQVNLACEVGGAGVFQFCIFDDLASLPIFCEDVDVACDASLQSFPLTVPPVSFSSDGTNPVYLFVSGSSFHPTDIEGYPDRTDFWQSISRMDLRTGLRGATWEPSHGCDTPLYFDIHNYADPLVYDIGDNCSHSMCDGDDLVVCEGSKITSVVDCSATNGGGGCSGMECTRVYLGEVGDVDTMQPCSSYFTYGYEVIEPDGPYWKPTTVYIGCENSLGVGDFQFCIFDDLGALPIFCEDKTFDCSSTTQSFSLADITIPFASDGTSPLYLFVSSDKFHPSDIDTGTDRTSFWQSIDQVDLPTGLGGATWAPSHGCDVPLYFEIELQTTKFIVGDNCGADLCDEDFLITCFGGLVTSIVDCTVIVTGGVCNDSTAPQCEVPDPECSENECDDNTRLLCSDGVIVYRETCRTSCISSELDGAICDLRENTGTTGDPLSVAGLVGAVVGPIVGVLIAVVGIVVAIVICMGNRRSGKVKTGQDLELNAVTAVPEETKPKPERDGKESDSSESSESG